MLHKDLPAYVSALSYPGVFLWFSVVEQLTPIPEEISLISLGYICVYTSLDPYLAGIAALAGLLSTDAFLFYLSMKGSRLSGKLVKRAEGSLLDSLRNKLKKHAGKTIFIMAMVPKLRFLSPIISGAAGISFRFFMLVNGIATLCYTVFYLLIGIIFYRQLNTVIHKFNYLSHTIFIVSMIVLGLFLIFIVRMLLKKKKDTPAN